MARLRKATTVKVAKTSSVHKDKLRTLIVKMRELKKAFAKKLKEEKAAAHQKGFKQGISEGSKPTKTKSSKKTRPTTKAKKTKRTTTKKTTAKRVTAKKTTGTRSTAKKVGTVKSKTKSTAKKMAKKTSASSTKGRGRPKKKSAA